MQNYYYLDDKSDTHGPMTLTEVNRLAEVGTIRQDTLIFTPKKKWKCYRELNEEEDRISPGEIPFIPLDQLKIPTLIPRPRGVLSRYADFWRHFFTIKGRATRADYWAAAIGNIILKCGIIILYVILYSTHNEIFSELLAICASVLNLMFLIGESTLMIRRLHDINVSNWKIVIIIGINAFLTIKVALFPYKLSLTELIFCIAIELYLLFRIGTFGPNRFGPDEKYLSQN